MGHILKSAVALRCLWGAGSRVSHIPIPAVFNNLTENFAVFANKQDPSSRML